MIAALLALGSNLGERPRYLRVALRSLTAQGVIRLRRCSDFLETAPVGGPSQGAYVNAVAWIETSFAPRPFLAHCKALERRLGRSPQGPRNGPRVLDLDLLFYADHCVRDEDLEVPHPRMTERRFVLEPAVQIVPRWSHPVRGTSVQELWRNLECSV